VAQNAEDLGSFTGSTLADNQTVKALLQALETSVEDISAVDTAVVDAGDNVNRLTASTSSDTEPATWKFLAVDCSDGSIKVIDKTFVEVE
jgi:fructose 1,6-bisphosphatase